MAKYNIPKLIEFMDIPEYQRLQALSPKRILDETDIVTMCFRDAIHWISIYQIFWPPFEEKDFYFVDIPSLVQFDPDREQLPEKFYEQMAVVLKTFWTIQLEDLYPEGDWQVEVCDENGLVVQAFVFDRPHEGKTKYRIPRLISLADIPEYQRLQKRNPGCILDEKDCAALYCRAIHWISLFKVLWPIELNGYGVSNVYLADYFPDRKQIPESFFQQINHLLKTFWTIQLEDLYPNGDWLVEILDDSEMTVQAIIYKRC